MEYTAFFCRCEIEYFLNETSTCLITWFNKLRSKKNIYEVVFIIELYWPIRAIDFFRRLYVAAVSFLLSEYIKFSLGKYSTRAVGEQQTTSVCRWLKLPSKRTVIVFVQSWPGKQSLNLSVQIKYFVPKF